MKQGRTMLRIALTLFGAIHLVVAICHERRTGNSRSRYLLHRIFSCTLSVFAPLVAVGLLWTRYIRLALWLFLTALCTYSSLASTTTTCSSLRTTSTVFHLGLPRLMPAFHSALRSLG